MSKPLPDINKLAFTLAEMGRLGYGSRSFLQGEIRAGRLRAVKRGAVNVVLAEDLAAWRESWAGTAVSYAPLKAAAPQPDAAA